CGLVSLHLFSAADVSAIARHSPLGRRSWAVWMPTSGEHEYRFTQSLPKRPEIGVPRDAIGRTAVILPDDYSVSVRAPNPSLQARRGGEWRSLLSLSSEF